MGGTSDGMPGIGAGGGKVNRREGIPGRPGGISGKTGGISDGMPGIGTGGGKVNRRGG